jgi:predicted RNA-binding protein with PIN domain
MPRKPEEVYAEIAAWPAADQLRLAAKIIEEAARRLGGPSRTIPEPAREMGRATAPSAPRATTRSSNAEPVAPAHAAVSAPQTQPRSMVVVDGSNFLGTTDGYNLATDASREELITRLQDFVHDHPTFRVITYFDGQKTSVRRAGGVEVRFTAREKPADFFILEGLKALSDEERRHTVLVTADRALGDSARKLGAKVEAPTSFHRRLPAPRRTAVGERGLNAAEVAAWEDYFKRPPERDPKKR